MKYASTAFLVLALGLAADARALCTTCTAVIMPGAPQVHLPLVGWAYGSAGTVTVAEAPEFGTWNAASETYEPSAAFAEIGIDRMTVHQSGTYRTVIFVAAQPAETLDRDTFAGSAGIFEGGAEGAFGATSLYLPIKGDQPGTAQVGGTLGAQVNPPQPGPGGGVRRILEILDFAHVEVDSSSEVSTRLVAVAADGTFDCAPYCRTPGIDIPATAQSYTLTLIVGHDAFEIPAAPAETYTLWLKACGAAITGTCQVVQLAGLEAVPLHGAITLEAGLLEGDTREFGIDIEVLDLWRLEPSPEDLIASTFDDYSYSPFTSNYWADLGADVNGALQGESSLVGMTYGSVATFRDDLPNDVRRVRATFDLDIGSLGLAHSDSVIPFFGQADAGVAGTTKSFDVFLRYLDGVYYIRGRLIRDDATVALTDAIPIAAGTHTVSVHFFAADPSDEDSYGFLRLRVGSAAKDVQLDDLTANNLLRAVDRYSVGASQPTLASNTPTRYLRFDNVTVHFAH